MQIQDTNQYNLLSQFVENHKKTPEECPNCLEEFNLTINPQADEDNLEKLAITKCSHVFHKTCIEESIANVRDACPICATEGIKATIEDSSKTGRLALQELLKPKNEKKRKVEEIEDATPSHEASNAEIVRYLFENDLLKSDAVLLQKEEASQLLAEKGSQTLLFYTIRWSKTLQVHVMTFLTNFGAFHDKIENKEKLDQSLFDEKSLVIPKKYIDAYNAHQAKKRKTLVQGENNSSMNKATDFETIKFHLEIRRRFALTMSEQEVSEIIDNFPAGTKIFFINETNKQPIVAEKTNTELGPVIKRSFLTEVLQNTTLQEYIENNNIMVPKKYREDYQRAAFHLRKEEPNANAKEQRKSDEEIAKELAIQYAELDNNYEIDEKLAKELQETGLTAEELARLKADEEYAKRLASEQ